LNKRNELFDYASKLTDEYFEGGIGLRAVKLKNYTSGDHECDGFEKLSERIIDKATELYGLNGKVSHNSDYINDPDGINDRQRLDHHVWCDGKLIMVIEDRAFVDKPFLLMKMAVIKMFKEIPFIKKISSNDVQFIILCLSVSLKETSKKTIFSIFGFEVPIIFLSGHQRGLKYNYFERGYDKEELKRYVNIVSDVFEKQ